MPGIHGGESVDKEDRVRALIVSVLAALLGACGFLDQVSLNGPGLNPNKVYLNRTDVISVSRRDTERYACRDGLLICVQRGIGFDCRCP